MDMSSAFRVIGDGLSIVSLALIYSSTQQAWKRIPANATIPMQAARPGKPAKRASRTAGLLVLPVIATVVLFAPTLLGVTREADDPMKIVVVFTFRAVIAAAFCLAHLQFLKTVFGTLEKEGVIGKP